MKQIIHITKGILHFDRAGKLSFTNYLTKKENKGTIDKDRILFYNKTIQKMNTSVNSVFNLVERQDAAIGASFKDSNRLHHYRIAIYPYSSALE